MKKSELKRYKRFTANVIGFIGVILLIYLSVPFFFDYEKNRQVIEKKILHNFGLNIKAKDKTKYSFLPSPRINLYNAEIFSFSGGQNKIGSAEKITLRIPFKKLVNLQKLNFYSVELFNAKINVKSSAIKDFYKYIKNDKHKNPIQFTKSKINFLNKEKLVLSLDIKKLDILNEDLINKIRFTGEAFNSEIKIEYQHSNLNKRPTSIVTISFPEIGIRLNSNINFDKKDKIYYGKTRVLYPKNQFYFEHKLKKKVLSIYNSNIVNNSFKGELLGEVALMPFFFFDLKLNINNFGFTKFFNNTFKKNENFLAKFIPFNKKINGNLKINIEEIKSSSRIISSANTSLEFKNGDVITKEIVLNFNKFGTTKIVGKILEQKNKKIFYFDSIINITNPKIFYSRFLIPKRKRTIIKPIKLIGNINLNTYAVALEKLYYNEQLDNELMLDLNEIINNSISQNTRKNFFDQSNLRKIVQFLFK